MKTVKYIVAKPNKYLSEDYINFNLKAALKTGWLIQETKTDKSNETEI